MMGIKEQMEDFEKRNKEGGTIHAEFKNRDGGIETECSIVASTDEVKALILSLAEEVCEAQNISHIEFFADLAMMSIIQKKGK